MPSFLYYDNPSNPDYLLYKIHYNNAGNMTGRFEVTSLDDGSKQTFTSLHDFMEFLENEFAAGHLDSSATDTIDRMQSEVRQHHERRVHAPAPTPIPIPTLIRRHTNIHRRRPHSRPHTRGSFRRRSTRGGKRKTRRNRSSTPLNI